MTDFEDRRARQVGGPFAEYDFLGRKQPHRLGLADYLLLIARIDPARVRRVPSTAIAEEGADEIAEFAFVDCPCGARPVVRQTLEQCKGCERWYVLFEQGVVFVTYGEMAPPPLVSG